ncbi:MAG: mobile mystery protein A, partial [Bacteroidota bacterium]
MKNQQLHLDQLERKLSPYGKANKSARPEIGWIRTIRKSLGMSLEQLGRKMGLSKQSIQNMEKRETTGAITISALNEVAQALDMELVYGFVPKGGSVMHLVEEKAKKMATEIVLRTSQNMRLEDQSLPYKRI